MQKINPIERIVSKEKRKIASSEELRLIIDCFNVAINKFGEEYIHES